MVGGSGEDPENDRTRTSGVHPPGAAVFAADKSLFVPIGLKYASFKESMNSLLVRDPKGPRKYEGKGRFT
ncbi:hypothetical protein PLACP1_15870 [Planifilum fimeticola]